MSEAALVGSAERSLPERLRRGPEIRAVFRSRRKAVGRHVVVHLRDRVGERADGPPRATVVAGRRVGTAVRRNRAKRRLRAALRECGMPRGRDVVLVAREGADEAPYAALRREVADGCWGRSHAA